MNHASHAPDLGVIRWPELRRELRADRSTVWRWQRSQGFPKPVRIGPNSVGWLRSEVNAWLAARVAIRDQAVVDHDQVRP